MPSTSIASSGRSSACRRRSSSEGFRDLSCVARKSDQRLRRRFEALDLVSIDRAARAVLRSMSCWRALTRSAAIQFESISVTSSSGPLGLLGSKLLDIQLDVKLLGAELLGVKPLGTKPLGVK
jgi:hypothetical protein